MNPLDIQQLSEEIRRLNDIVRRHTHDRIETDKLRPEKSLRGIPVVEAVPSGDPGNGLNLYLVNDSGTYKLAAYIDGAWRTFTAD